MNVFVVNKNGRALMPTTPRKSRLFIILCGTDVRLLAQTANPLVYIIFIYINNLTFM